MKKKTQEKSAEEKNKGKEEVEPNNPDTIPHGREAVKKAILDATEKLLLERNPNKISVREIAKIAKVKHPLIYRHFGTKDKLIMEVHARNIGEVQIAVGDVQSIEGNIDVFFRAVEKNRFRQIALARAMLDGVNPHLLQHQFPVMQHFLQLIKKKRDKSKSELKFNTEIIAAVLGATALGWMIYEPFLLAATGLEGENKDEIKQQVAEILEEFIRETC